MFFGRVGCQTCAAPVGQKRKLTGGAARSVKAGLRIDQPVSPVPRGRVSDKYRKLLALRHQATGKLPRPGASVFISRAVDHG